jgi:PAS domain S-box-containing protein
MENKLIVGNASEAIISVEKGGMISSWNPAAEKAFGWNMGEAVGMRLDDAIQVDEDEDPGVFHSLGLDKEASDKVQFERVVKRPDGRSVPFEFVSSNVLMEDEWTALIFAREITVRRQRQQALVDAYQNQRIMNDILSVSLLPISFNEQLGKILDLILSIETIKLLPNGAILLVDDQPGTLCLKVEREFSDQQKATCAEVPFGKCHCGRAASSGKMQYVECIDESHDFIFEKMKPHGHYCVPIIYNDAVLGVIALYIQEGHRANDLEVETLTAIANVVAGIVERRKMEGQLEDLVAGMRETIKDLDNERTFNESVISNLASGLLVLNNEKRIQKCNPAARQILGDIYDGDLEQGELEEVLGSEVAGLIMTKRAPGSMARDEVGLRDTTGRKKVIEYVVVDREDGAGNKQGSIINFQDVTEYKKIHAEMEKMNRFSTIAEIASAVAHEVRNPLAGIRTMSQAIDEQLTAGDDKKEYIGRIIRQVDRLNVILTDFFTYARPPKPEKKKVQIRSIIDEIRPFMLNRMFKSGITLEEEYSENLPEVLVDPNQIQQVFLNLMLNSTDAIKHNGSISIWAEDIGTDRSRFGLDKYPWLKEDSRYVVILFSDTGSGMSDEVMERVFEPFFTTKHDGTGLGMAIVFRILKENNAGIHVERNKPQGTTFTLFFSVD